MRFLCRFFSFIALVLAVGAGVTDSIESVASSAVVTTSFESLWGDVDASGLALVKQWVATHIGGWALQWMQSALLQQPAFAIFLGLALVLWMAGYKRPSPEGRFAA
ncbi:hypothetical protein [Rhizobium oryziradicis]|uniref:Uncharacterized protein n=1 Tax=Rhizobium oryziradicis TaxID=1867956 RepID=A0A1Q8ZU48_9HYPH|nr:hypothetical protein [Rhizobium oryziradicis]OLP45458.1 hypothetical protein BJF95_18235 [Rhizobium oryziradicis]